LRISRRRRPQQEGRTALRFVDILPSTFRECGWDKRDEKAVMRHLREGMLICSKPNELKMQRKEPQIGDLIPVYRIRAAFFGEEITYNLPGPVNRGSW
jgi:hypothetical protein